MPKTKVAAQANAAAAKTAKMSVKSKTSKAIKKTGPAKGGAKSAEGDAKKTRKIRFKAGTIALREIKRYQKSMDNLLPRAAFMRLVKHIATDMDH